MGYTTEFEGRFNLDKPLSQAHKSYLQAFADTRRMKRDATKTANMPDSLRDAVGLPLGVDGEFFVGASAEGDYGQSKTDDIIDYNEPPTTQPGLWCQWDPSEDGMGIEWNGMEKFYSYIDWLQYLVSKFLQPWGYTLSGSVRWQGEDSSDFGEIVVYNNAIVAKTGRKVYD